MIRRNYACQINSIQYDWDYVHTGPDEIRSRALIRLFTAVHTKWANYRPESVHTELDEIVSEII
jgi:hypothetical protein